MPLDVDGLGQLQAQVPRLGTDRFWHLPGPGDGLAPGLLAGSGRLEAAVHDGGDRPGPGEVLPGGGVEHLVQVGSGQGGRVDLALEDRPLGLGLIAGVLGWGQPGS